MRNPAVLSPKEKSTGQSWQTKRPMIAGPSSTSSLHQLKAMAQVEEQRQNNPDIQLDKLPVDPERAWKDLSAFTHLGGANLLAKPSQPTEDEIRRVEEREAAWMREHNKLMQQRQQQQQQAGDASSSSSSAAAVADAAAVEVEEDLDYAFDLELEFQELEDYWGAKAKDELENRTLFDSYDIFTEDRRKRKWCAGDEYYELAQRLISKFENPPSDQQLNFIENVIDTCIAQIYGKDFNSRRSDLMKQRGWREFKKIVLLTCGRRFGKTMGAAMAAAILLYVCPRGINMVSPCIVQ
jgi:hypothetical protein